MIDRRRCLLSLSAMLVAACAGVRPAPSPPAVAVTPPPAARKLRIGLALGGGAARGFAHIGVIKALETNGIVPEVIAGTSAGAVVGALYASGINAFDLQKLAFELDAGAVTDWNLFDRGWVKGEALEAFINKTVANRPLEKLDRRFGAVATNLQRGEMVVFASGNTGQAVRASAAVPGVFSPVTIAGVEYVDGGVSSPVPVRAARQLGADFVIAVDISNRPSGRSGRGSIDVLLDAVAIMGSGLADYEARQADVLVRPAIQGLAATTFEDRHKAILEGERAGFAAVAKIRERLQAAAQGA